MSALHDLLDGLKEYRAAEYKSDYMKSVIAWIMDPETVKWTLTMKRSPQPHYAYFKLGDYVTRDGTDVHRITALEYDSGAFECVVEPAISEPGAEPWIRKGETEFNLCRRYQAVDYRPDEVAS